MAYDHETWPEPSAILISSSPAAVLKIPVGSFAPSEHANPGRVDAVTKPQRDCVIVMANVGEVTVKSTVLETEPRMKTLSVGAGTPLAPLPFSAVFQFAAVFQVPASGPR